MKKVIKPKLIIEEDGRKGLCPGISIIHARAIGLTHKDLWRMAENGESTEIEEDELNEAYKDMRITAEINYEDGTQLIKVLKDSGEEEWDFEKEYIKRTGEE